MNKTFSDLIDDKARAEFERENPKGRWDDLSEKCQKLWRIGALDMIIGEQYQKYPEAFQKWVMGEACVMPCLYTNNHGLPIAPLSHGACDLFSKTLGIASKSHGFYESHYAAYNALVRYIRLDKPKEPR